MKKNDIKLSFLVSFLDKFRPLMWQIFRSFLYKLLYPFLKYTKKVIIERTKRTKKWREQFLVKQNSKWEIRLRAKGHLRSKSKKKPKHSRKVLRCNKATNGTYESPIIENPKESPTRYYDKTKNRMETTLAEDYWLAQSVKKVNITLDAQNSTWVFTKK